ncbi:Gnt-II system L-idonate transporter [Corynebacterium diphtheriae subsp. lausannense]|nr:Gnt-II system L-idonate transporter [Corynebacterium diphtheriae subsp. lausannense]
MEDWVPTLSAGPLLGIAAAAIALILVLVIVFKLHAFLTLIIVSAATGLAAGIPLEGIVPTMTKGFGSTLASVALLVGLGAMLGRLVETSGGAKSLAETLVARFGEQRAPFALGVASLLMGFPIFFDAGLIVMLPVIFAVARRLNGPVLSYGIPTAGAFSVMHIYLPPHPGPISAAEFYSADIGLVMLLGLIIAIPTWLISGLWLGKTLGRRYPLPVPDILAGGPQAADVKNPATPGLIVSLLLFPMLLIFGNTGMGLATSAGWVDKSSSLVRALQFVGNTPIALLISTLVALYFLGIRRGQPKADLEKLLDGALGPICSVVLITGAGGMFGGVLRTSGIGDALADSMSDLGVPVILGCWLGHRGTNHRRSTDGTRRRCRRLQRIPNRTHGAGLRSRLRFRRSRQRLWLLARRPPHGYGRCHDPAHLDTQPGARRSRGLCLCPRLLRSQLCILTTLAEPPSCGISNLSRGVGHIKNVADFVIFQRLQRSKLRIQQ